LSLPRPTVSLPTGRHSQDGVALLTILLLVVSITVVAGAMLASQKIAIRQSGLLFQQDQLLQDVQAGSQFATAVISADSKLNDTDSAQDIWAQPIPSYPLGNNIITVEIYDEASRFNLNNLYHDDAVDVNALGAFKRLLKQLGLEESVAIAVLDWQDPDSSVYEDSAEESAIYQSTLASGTGVVNLPNQPFFSVEQLASVDGITAEGLAALRPYVSAVPYYLPVNVNTALPEVLAAIIEGSTPEQMQALVRVRESQTFADIESLWQVAPFNSLPEESRGSVEGLLAVDSQAFTALITAAELQADVGQAPKQRFATVMISKRAKDDNSGGNAADTPQENGSNSAGAKEAKEVQAFSQRLWPYRPTAYAPTNKPLKN